MFLPSCAYVGNIPDIFSLIGTVFLWIYWPSFVAGAAEADSAQQERAIVNTILSLSVSTVCTFWLSSLLSKNGRLRPVDIQNATLAGGVAIGCTANLSMSAFAAVMIGASAGLVSAFGYNVLQPMLEENLGLHDTCGVHNLHAMPSVIGALASVIVAGYEGTMGIRHDTDIYGVNIKTQWAYQLAGILLCISFAISTGLITGKLLKFLGPAEDDEVKEVHDDQYWEVAEDYGRSLYSELALIIRDSDDKLGVKHSILEAMPMFSAHGGRKGEGLLALSRHGNRPESALGHGLSASIHGLSASRNNGRSSLSASQHKPGNAHVLAALSEADDMKDVSSKQQHILASSTEQAVL